MIVNGDITQIDLKSGEESGLVEAVRAFSDVDGIKVCHLNIDDVVRHPLVQTIIEKYKWLINWVIRTQILILIRVEYINKSFYHASK